MEASETTTDVVLVTGEAVTVEGDTAQVERELRASGTGGRDLVWLTEALIGRRVGINPSHIVLIRPGV